MLAGVFSQRELTRHESSIIEKAFWEMIFWSVDVLPMYEFLRRYTIVVRV